MAKAKSLVLHSPVKKEEHEDKPKQEILVHVANNETENINKITKKRKPMQTHVKTEDTNDNKALLASPMNIFKRSRRRTKITTEQIAKLIGHIVNDKMSVRAASRKIGVGQSSAHRYYHQYLNDPEHKIPLPNKRTSTSTTLTQQKIDEMIRYIVNDGMNVTEAAKKADIHRSTAAIYHTKYLEDPERKTPLLADRNGDRSKRYTQEEINDLIGYIVRDKMTIMEASKKVNMYHSTARRYYLKFLHDPNHEIPDRRESIQRSGKHCTNEQVKSLIGYIDNDGMTLLEASVKANMGKKAANKYYKQYLEDPENSIPNPEINNHRGRCKPSTFDQVENFFRYVIIDQLSIAQATCKAKISRSNGHKLYTRYLKSPTQETEMKDLSYSVEKMKRLVKLVQNEKMSVTAAAGAVHLSVGSACRQYQQYLEDPRHEFPATRNKKATQDDIKKLIDLIEGEKINVTTAARRVKISTKTAYKYYTLYQNDPEHRIPAPRILGQSRKGNRFNKYTKMVADIYKSNPSIKPIHENYPSNLDTFGSKIKQEPVEEDVKMLLEPENN